MSAWKRLRAAETAELEKARMQLHYAAQVVSGVGRTLLPHQADDSHTNLVWMEELGALAGHLVGGDRAFRAALQLERFRLLVLDSEDRTLFEGALAGKTVAQAYSWLEGAIVSRLGTDFPGFTPLHYTLPEHALGRGGAFSFEPASAFAEMSRWYSNAASALEGVRHEHGGSAVRCWPHHFDIATLIPLGQGRTIGVGMSPGDGSYNEPYWYVGPYPYPKPDEWPQLAGKAHWHTEGYVAAVLTASDFVKENDQPKRLDEFLDVAIEACRTLLG
ncbi:MAG: hypothetical protein GC160_03790 [Acidobacteria bacterium]|nr:hypothetical protein [Acidobacteriota bacterium]